MRFLALLPLLLAAACQSTEHADVSRPYAEPAPEVQWCGQDCAVGEGHDLESLIKTHGTAAETYFLDILRTGPDPRVLADLEDQARQRYAGRQEQLAMAYVEEDFDADTLRSVRSATLDEYVRDAVAKYDTAYRARAISGLVLLHSRAAIPDLRRVAADTASPLQANARDALAKLQ
jgi:hypothetical protein